MWQGRGRWWVAQNPLLDILQVPSNYYSLVDLGSNSSSTILELCDLDKLPNLSEP